MSTTYTRLIRDWQLLLEHYPLDLRLRIAERAHEQRSFLAENFYTHMLADAQAGPLLAHQQVKARLEPSMQRWISSLLAAQSHEQLQEQMVQQKKIGEIHARLNIPLALVLRGARHLKASLNQQLAQAFSGAELSDALSYGNACIDIAMELMSDVYSESHSRNERAEEAYRLFSVTQNIGAERQRQRAALLDWENQLMFDVASGMSAEQLPRVSKSEFGLWFRHKAHDSFQGAPQMEQIEQLLQDIDERYLPEFGSTANALAQLREVRESAKSVHYLLDSLFEQANAVESGRDALTQLLNRKFLPVVLGKQVHTARKTESQFALLMADVDHFKQINDRYGHEVGDQALQQVANVLSECMRAGDYAFRHGGEEFLLLIVDTNSANACTLAERIRQQVELQPLKLANDVTVNITISIGIALHDGHPDYLRSLRLADNALYQAKANGRNTCVLAGA